MALKAMPECSLAALSLRTTGNSVTLRHVPANVLQVPHIPHTKSAMIVELTRRDHAGGLLAHHFALRVHRQA